MKIANNIFAPYVSKMPKNSDCQKPQALQFDSVSFSSNGRKTLTKADLLGFDYLCNELFKFPLEKMSSRQDFDNFAREEAEKYLSVGYPTKRDALNILQDARAKELEVWKKYLLQESPSCSEKPSIALVIAKGLVKNLKTSNEALPQVLNKEVLENTIKELEGKLLADKKTGLNFMEQYNLNLKTYYLEKTRQENFSGSDGNGFWVKIMSMPDIDSGGPLPDESEEDYDKRVDEKYEQIFQENIKKMRILSHSNWCTSSYMAQEYLRQGDFHIFIQNKEPRFAIRFEGDKIAEIEEPQNNRKVQQESTIILDRYIAKNGYKYQPSSNVNEGFVKLCAQLNQHVKNKDYFSILESLGFEPEVLESGKLSINGYNRTSYDYTMKDFGIDENEMFENIETIRGDVELRGTDLKSLGAVKTIRGDLDCEESNLDNFGELKLVKGDLKPKKCPLVDLGKIQIIGGNLDLSGSEFTRLGYLVKVGGNLTLTGSNVRRLDNLKEVGGDLHLEGSTFEETGKLKIKQKDGTIKILPKFEKLEKVSGTIFLSKHTYTDEMDEELWSRDGLSLAKFV